MTVAMVLPFSSNTGSEPTVALYFNGWPSRVTVCWTVLSAGKGGRLMSPSLWSLSPPLLSAALESSLGASAALAKDNGTVNKPQARRHAANQFLGMGEDLEVGVDLLCDDRR